MMGSYAVVIDGLVANTIVWDGNLEEWTPPNGAVMVEIPDGESVSIGYTYDGTKFISPPPPPVIPPTAAEILSENTLMRDSLLAAATLAIAPLQDAVDLDDATAAETALLKKWKQYRVAVNRINLTLASPTWPKAPA